MGLRNLDIRLIVDESELKYSDIAATMGISATWLSILLKNDLSAKNKARILRAIRELREAEK